MTAASVLIPTIGLVLVLALLYFVTMIGTHATTASPEVAEAIDAVMGHSSGH